MYVLYYRLFDRAYYKNCLPIIHKEIDKQYPNLPVFYIGGCKALSKKWLKRDMVYSLHRYGVNFTEYFVYKYYQLNVIGRVRNSYPMSYCL